MCQSDLADVQYVLSQHVITPFIYLILAGTETLL